ncbi:hypothetical protein CXB51_000158 [Gossypium anomalum]|uniref:non-specific serine/threonine protein kinase n=1 Tax=Gossypium anomalum TaxID=47600 RepID=A0A8J5ZJ20_9ROSI|nr:hypothetical protein CXB51_000158 [Gossypium anomalum]
MVQRKGSEKYYRSGLWNGDGFSGRPKWLERWNSLDWSHGCIHSKPLNYRSGDGFIRIGKVKTPDTPSSWVNKTINLKECRTRCLRNCSCMAYTNLDVRKGGSGCVMWFGYLIDIKQYQSGGQDLYIRVSASEAGTDYEARICSYFILKEAMGIATLCFILFSNEVEDKNNEDMELAVFEFGTIAQATDSFSFNNKLRTLATGQEIAVKRLSKSSRQGLNKFKNEHRNLVRLLGCCIQGDERMLVYAYMPNRSLDSFIFCMKINTNLLLTNMNACILDQIRRTILTWYKRFQIIYRIARGLLYLHQNLRLRIIRRDLKTSNILLDSEMNLINHNIYIFLHHAWHIYG